MTTTSKSSLYFHIVATYRNAKQPWDEKNPLTHITIRKGYYKSEDDAFSSVVSILTDHISNLEELCPKSLFVINTLGKMIGGQHQIFSMLIIICLMLLNL